MARIRNNVRKRQTLAIPWTCFLRDMFYLAGGKMQTILTKATARAVNISRKLYLVSRMLDERQKRQPAG